AVRRRARKVPLKTSQVKQHCCAILSSSRTVLASLMAWLVQVVQEPAPPLLAGFTVREALTALGRLIPEQKRPLRPNPNPRRATNVLVNECALLVQLVSGRNIPLRTHGPNAVFE